MCSFWPQSDEIPKHVGIFQMSCWISFLSVDETVDKEMQYRLVQIRILQIKLGNIHLGRQQILRNYCHSVGF